MHNNTESSSKRFVIIFSILTMLMIGFYLGMFYWSQQLVRNYSEHLYMIWTMVLGIGTFLITVNCLITCIFYTLHHRNQQAKYLELKKLIG